jgi:hypothetical protein
MRGSGAQLTGGIGLLYGGVVLLALGGFAWGAYARI